MRLKRDLRRSHSRDGGRSTRFYKSSKKSYDFFFICFNLFHVLWKTYEYFHIDAQGLLDMFHVFAEASSLWQFSCAPIISKLWSPSPPPTKKKSYLENCRDFSHVHICTYPSFQNLRSLTRPPPSMWLQKITSPPPYIAPGIWTCGKYEEVCGNYEGFLHIPSFFLHIFFILLHIPGAWKHSEHSPFSKCN